MATERDSLEIHVDLCELRYKALEDRMTRIEQKVQDISIDVQDFKEEVRRGFSEIKDMLTVAKDEKFKTVIVTAGSVIVGLLALLGYIVVHLK
jgi:predicted  nucleic acid-binding Zn-ribbon protein